MESRQIMLDCIHKTIPTYVSKQFPHLTLTEVVLLRSKVKLHQDDPIMGPSPAS